METKDKSRMLNKLKQWRRFNPEARFIQAPGYVGGETQPTESIMAISWREEDLVFETDLSYYHLSGDNMTLEIKAMPLPWPEGSARAKLTGQTRHSSLVFRSISSMRRYWRDNYELSYGFYNNSLVIAGGVAWRPFFWPDSWP